MIEYSKDIPNWNHRYIYSFNELRDTNFEQLSFYNTYKELFFKEEFIDVKGNDNYTFILYFDIIKTFKNNFKLLKKHFKNLEQNYPITESYVNSYLIEQFEENKDFEYSWKLILKQDYIGLSKIIEYEKKLNRELLNGEFIIKLGGYSHLTNFGQNNIDNIKPYVDKQIIIYKKGRNFFDSFLKNGLPFKLKKPFLISLNESVIFPFLRDLSNRLFISI